MVKTENFHKVEVRSVSQLRGWLEANHTQKESVWLVIYEKHAGGAYISREEVLDEVLWYSVEHPAISLIRAFEEQHRLNGYLNKALRRLE